MKFRSSPDGGCSPHLPLCRDHRYSVAARCGYPVELMTRQSVHPSRFSGALKSLVIRDLLLLRSRNMGFRFKSEKGSPSIPKGTREDGGGQYPSRGCPNSAPSILMAGPSVLSSFGALGCSVNRHLDDSCIYRWTKSSLCGLESVHTVRESRKDRYSGKCPEFYRQCSQPQWLYNQVVALESL